MKSHNFEAFLLLISVLVIGCKNDPPVKIVDYKIPALIINAQLVDKFNAAKWAIYSRNMADSVLLMDSSQLVSFLELDLGVMPNDTDTSTTYLANDTVITISFSPSYKSKFTDFERYSRNMVYGASFKDDSIKYMPNGDKGFLVCSDSMNNIQSLKLIKHLKKHRRAVNQWLVYYAISKNYISFNQFKD